MGWIKKLSLAVFSLTAGLLLLEGLLRILSPAQTGPRWFIVHPRYGYFQRANFDQVYGYADFPQHWHVRLNNHGLRGPDFRGAQPGERRVLLLGDSFTFGYGLEEDQIFATRLQQKLEAGGGTWRVINAGVGGWGTLQELLFARDHLELFQPDVVVITFCDNDLQDDALFLAGKSSGLLPSFPGKHFLRDHSALYRSAYALLAPVLFKRALHQSPPASPDNRPATPSPPGRIDQSNPEGPDLLSGRESQWPATLKAIRDFHAELMAFNPQARLIVQQAQPLRSDIYLHLRTLDNGTSLRYLHLGEEVTTWPDNSVLLPYDPHWKPEVHELSARRLAEIILAHQLPAPGS